MKSPWPTKKLGEICEEKKEKNIKNLSLPVYAVSNIFGFVLSEEFFSKRVYSESLRNYKLVYKHDFVYNPARVNVGSLGLFREDAPGLISPMYIVFYIKDKNILDPHFLFYLLKTNLYQNKIKNLAASRGSIRQTLKLEDLLNLEIPFPPLPIQQKIVKIFDTIQSAVEIQEKIIEKTKELKKSLMAELFKYGAPSFRNPEPEQARYGARGRKLKKTETLNQSKLGTGQVGEIPEDWEVVRLGDVCDFQGGTQPPKQTFIYEPKEGYVRLLQIRDFETDKYPTYVKQSPKLRYVNKEDILLARYGASVGKILRGLSGAINVAIMKVILNEKRVTKDFFYYFLQTPKFQNFLRGLGVRSAQTGFNKEELRPFLIPLPPLSEQQEIAEILRTIDQKIEIEKKKKELYEELFKTMLNKIMSQEINVEKIEV